MHFLNVEIEFCSELFMDSSILPAHIKIEDQH
jgi:hypothetical protein